MPTSRRRFLEMAAGAGALSLATGLRSADAGEQGDREDRLEVRAVGEEDRAQSAHRDQGEGDAHVPSPQVPVLLPEQEGAAQTLADPQQTLPPQCAGTKAQTTSSPSARGVRSAPCVAYAQFTQNCQ